MHEIQILAFTTLWQPSEGMLRKNSNRAKTASTLFNSKFLGNKYTEYNIENEKNAIN